MLALREAKTSPLPTLIKASAFPKSNIYSMLRPLLLTFKILKLIIRKIRLYDHFGS
jgi:hypothetical protein